MTKCDLCGAPDVTKCDCGWEIDEDFDEELANWVPAEEYYRVAEQLAQMEKLLTNPTEH